MSHRFAFSILFTLVACSQSPHAVPDGGVIPRSPDGMFAVTSKIDLIAPVPGPAAAVVADLVAMTDGPDDPSRYIIDRLIATMPEGSAKTAAQTLAPFVAAYLNTKLTAIAPRFVMGVRAISDDLDQITRHFTTLETMRITDQGATRSIGGIRVELAGGRPVDLAFAADTGASLQVTLDRLGHLTFSEHVVSVAYGRMLRAGLDTAVIPSVDPGATDLARALRDLVDCAQLGKLVSDKVGLGSPTLYEAACATGMTAAASDIYARLTGMDGLPLELHMMGNAHASDLDGNGTMDAFDTGDWKGTAVYNGLANGLGPTPFVGVRQ